MNIYMHCKVAEGNFFDTCDSHLCNEIQAYHKQACLFSKEYATLPKQNQILSLIDNIIESASMRCAQEYTDKTTMLNYMENYIKKNFDRCSKYHRSESP